MKTEYFNFAKKDVYTVSACKYSFGNDYIKEIMDNAKIKVKMKNIVEEYAKKYFKPGGQVK